MEKKYITIEKKGNYTFGDNYELIFRNKIHYLLNCNITCGNNCIIDCGGECNITCGNNCEIKSTHGGKIICGNDCEIICRGNCNFNCGNNCEISCWYNCNINCGNDCKIKCGGGCNITCGNDCKIKCKEDCYIKAGEGSKITPYDKLIKTILKDEEFIWWYIRYNYILINTFEDVDWQRSKPDKWDEFYGYVTNELDSATLF